MSTLYDELSRVTTYEYTHEEVREFEALHEEIRRLKKERNAVIVAHNYYRPEILKVADFVGDSLELALMASQVRDSDIIRSEERRVGKEGGLVWWRGAEERGEEERWRSVES